MKPRDGFSQEEARFERQPGVLEVIELCADISVQMRYLTYDSGM